LVGAIIIYILELQGGGGGGSLFYRLIFLPEPAVYSHNVAGAENLTLKVDGNEKLGGSGKRQ
jgi:hypothetical protein